MTVQRLSQQVRTIILLAIAAIFVPVALAQDAACTLADHIRSANSNTSVGGCPRGTSHDIITITEDMTLTEPLPWIRGTITIEGGGHTISGNKEHPIFVVIGGRLTINNLTLTEGFDKPSEASGWISGGALRIGRGGEVIVNHSLFVENNNDGHGGAIGVFRGKLTVNNSSFVKNRARGDGGAISIGRSTGVISNSSFISNETRLAQVGGAIGVDREVTLSVANSTFYDNYAGEGGAIGTSRHPLDRICQLKNNSDACDHGQQSSRQGRSQHLG